MPYKRLYPNLHLYTLSSTGDIVRYSKAIKKGRGLYNTQYFYIFCNGMKDNSFKPRESLCLLSIPQ